ncbi:uncharacterized protein LOC122952307 [Acropora millepora]|uniref:uncharacterized protein LOC122952307 n=1 Tax=Acropora millepora TaxID=45264 RepID=UPI001CF59E09|nr:uncharacterized protein LOC122952307 [Acropora millepora]
MAKEAFNADEVFEKQVKACTEFFRENLPKDVAQPIPEDKKPKSVKKFTGTVYDITEFDAEDVVALLSEIVNDKKQFTTNKTFYLLLQNSHGTKPEDEIKELFRLKARPTKDQPGNAIVFLRPRGKQKFTKGARKYDELNGALEAHYGDNTELFAQDIKEIFQNNSVINGDFPQATVEAYIFLLFEIARRLVTVTKPSAKKEEFDVLPIGSAIARSVELLEKKACKFKDVFLPKEKFHCFTGQPQDRRTAIDRINNAISDIAQKNEEMLGTGSENHCKELEEMFRSNTKAPHEKLNNLTLQDKEYRPMKSSIDTEKVSFEDYSDSKKTPSNP